MKINAKILTLVFAGLFLFISCKMKDKDEIPKNVQTLIDQTIKIHDEVMPKTSIMHRLKKQIKTRLDNTTLNDKLLERAIVDLEIADESMMDWMHKFKQFDALDKDVDYLNYYQMKKMEITRVKKQILTAINNAKILLEHE